MYEGSHHDSTKNGMQAYRIGMQVIRDTLLAAPQSMFIDESIRDGNVRSAIRGLPSPADIGIDTRRMHIAVPLLTLIQR